MQNEKKGKEPKNDETQNGNSVSINLPFESKYNGGNKNNGMHELDLNNTTFHMERFLRNNPKNIKDLLRENRDGSSSQIIRKNELVIAFKLLKNQAKIMNNGLDDVYYKTKQEPNFQTNVPSCNCFCP